MIESEGRICINKAWKKNKLAHVCIIKLLLHDSSLRTCRTCSTSIVLPLLPIKQEQCNIFKALSILSASTNICILIKLVQPKSNFKFVVGTILTCLQKTSMLCPLGGKGSANNRGFLIMDVSFVPSNVRVGHWNTGNLHYKLS